MTTAEPLTEPGAASAREGLWRNSDFLKFWLGETLSLLGTQITNLALPLTAIYAFQATDEQVGLLRFLQLAPYLGLALLFGSGSTGSGGGLSWCGPTSPEWSCSP